MKADNNDVVIIQLDRPRQLRFTHTAIKTLLAMTGMTMEELDQDMNFQNPEFIEQFAYCGLLRDAKNNGETLQFEQMPDLLDESPSMAHTYEKLVEAWQVAFGVKPQSSEGNPEMPAAEPVKGKRTTGEKASK